VSGSSTDERLVEEAVEAIAAGQPVVLPTDTVYGLCASPLAPESLSRLKRRGPDQPIALLASDVDILLELVPELPHEALHRLLPGRLTLILPNPGGRFPLLAGSRPETIGVRVPELQGAALRIVTRVGAVAATSANLHGRPDPRRLDEVPQEIRPRRGDLRAPRLAALVESSRGRATELDHGRLDLRQGSAQLASEALPRPVVGANAACMEPSALWRELEQVRPRVVRVRLPREEPALDEVLHLVANRRVRDPCLVGELGRRHPAARVNVKQEAEHVRVEPVRLELAPHEQLREVGDEDELEEDFEVLRWLGRHGARSYAVAE
jgi:L-threonylcarbamoyladenylate synthase